jgi:hypothetical protein
MNQLRLARLAAERRDIKKRTEGDEVQFVASHMAGCDARDLDSKKQIALYDLARAAIAAVRALDATE